MMDNCIVVSNILLKVKVFGASLVVLALSLEDNLVIAAYGPVNLTEALPRTEEFARANINVNNDQLMVSQFGVGVQMK